MFVAWFFWKGILDDYCGHLRIADVFWHGFFKMGGTKAGLKFFCIVKGRVKERGEIWDQGDHPHKQSWLQQETFFVQSSRMIPWTGKSMTWTVTEAVTLDQTSNSVVYNVYLTRIWPFKLDYFLWSVWVNVCPALGAFESGLFWHLEGMMDMCLKSWGLKQGESSVFLMSWIRYCMGQTELLQMPHEALNHPGIIPCFSGIWDMCSCLSWACLSCAPRALVFLSQFCTPFCSITGTS